MVMKIENKDEANMGVMSFTPLQETRENGLGFKV